MLNLVSQVQDFFSNQLIEKAATYLTEKEETIQKILKIGVPCVLKGIVSKAGKDDGSGLLNMAKQTADMQILNSSVNIFNAAEIPHDQHTQGDWLSLIFGKKSEELLHAVAAYTGADARTTTPVLNAIVPVCLSYIGEHVKANNNFSSSHLSTWLSSQLNAIKNLLPQDARFSNILNERNPLQSQGNLHTLPASQSESRGSSNLLLWVLLGLLFVALCWYLMRSCNHDQPQTTIPENVDTIHQNEAPLEVRESLKVKLVNGVEIDAYKNGIEDSLVKCLNNPLCKASKDAWFDFDNLNFKAGSDSLTSESLKQVKNIAEVLNAYPAVKVKIGGYADRSGDSTKSWQLSAKRAIAVYNEIKAQGAKENQLAGTEGYGWQFAKYPSTAPESDRRKDRRISLQLREK